MMLATYIQCSITMDECYNYYYKCTCYVSTPVITNSYYYRTDEMF